MITLKFMFFSAFSQLGRGKRENNKQRWLINRRQAKIVELSDDLMRVPRELVDSSIETHNCLTSFKNRLETFIEARSNDFSFVY